MDCMEFVLSKCTKAEQKEIERLLTSKSEWTDKNNLVIGNTYIFVVGFHIGFGKLNGEHNFETLEYNEGKELRRLLSIFDDNVKILFEKEDAGKLWVK